MNFLNPWALLGLVSVPVIIGLHLHLERNRRVVISSMFLWAFLEAKFEGQKPKFVQISWLLIMDILIAGLLSLAFAQPVVKLPTLGGQGVQRVILIDDSTSMLAQDGNPDRFSMAKDLAISLIEEARGQDESIVITFGGNAKFIGSTEFSNAEDLIGIVEGLAPLGTGVDLRAALALAQSEAYFDLPIEVYVLTDAAYELVNIKDFPVEVNWVFVGFEQNNQAVIDPVLEERDSKTELFFNLVNYGLNQVERDLEIRVNRQVINQRKTMLSPLSVQPQVISITGQIETVEIQLIGEDSLQIDDIAMLSIHREPVVKVAIVTENPDPIDRAIQAVAGTDLKVLSPFEYSAVANFDLVVFRGMIPDIWPSGKVIVFDPPEGNPKFEVTGLELISAPLETTPHQILDGVDLAGVRWETVWTVSDDTPGERLLQAGRLPLLIRQDVNDSEIFFFLPQISAGNFTKHPAFPIFFASMVEYAKDFSPKPNYRLGETLELGNALNNHTIKLLSPNADASVRVIEPSMKLDEIGLYTLDMTNRDGEELQYQFGVNAGDLSESNILPREWRLPFANSNPISEIGIQSIEVNLSPWILFVVVILLVLEAERAWR